MLTKEYNQAALELSESTKALQARCSNRLQTTGTFQVRRKCCKSFRPGRPANGSAPWRFQCPILCTFPYGESLGRKLWEWMCLVKFSPANEHPTLKPSGTSWLELSLGFMLWAQEWLPVLRRREGTEWSIQPTSATEAGHLGVTWIEAAEVFARMIKAILALAPVPCWPAASRARVNSCLGGPQWAQGNSRRMSFPGDGEVMPKFRALFIGHENAPKNYGVPVPWEPVEASARPRSDGKGSPMGTGVAALQCRGAKEEEGEDCSGGSVSFT